METIIPGSAEEAAALLGASLNRFGGGSGSGTSQAVLPPVGMHPAFAVVTTNGTTEIIHRLYLLRSLLRTVAANHSDSSTSSPLPSAPSILQVLKKLLGVSTQMAATAAAAPVVGTPSSMVASSTSAIGTPTDTTAGSRRLVALHRSETPLLWSTPCRDLWVDCIVVCFCLFPASQELTQFVRQMLALASIHPRSAKAAGGVRIAALAVLAALLDYDHGRNFSPNVRYPFASQLAPWSLDVLQVCLKALRSAGNGEPTFRHAAIRAATATGTACRHAAWKHRSDQDALNGGDAKALAASLATTFYLTNAMEEKAVAESIKVLKQAATDKFPEIRHGAALFAATLTPLLTTPNSSATSGPTDAFAAALDDVVQLALRNLDDEYPVVAAAWADVVARGLTTALQCNEAFKKLASEQRSDAGDGTTTSGSTAVSPASRFGTRKPVGLVYTMTSVKKVLEYLVDQFVSCGGDLVAARAGGVCSMGGRMVRLGYSLALGQFLQLQTCVLSAVGESRSISLHATLLCVLDVVGPKLDQQVKTAMGTRNWSKSDLGCARLLASRVVRRGLSQLAPEPFQLSILQELVSLLPKVRASQGTTGGTAPDVAALNAHQLQVVMVEISHLFATLGEAAGSYVDETLTKLQGCLGHADGAVRMEACIACTAVVASFPTQGPQLVETSIKVILTEFAQLGSAVAEKVEAKSSVPGFRRTAKPTNPSVESWRVHEFSIYGRSLLVSMLVRDLTALPGGLAGTMLSSVLTTAETLVSSQFNDNVTILNTDAICACVRAGYCMISGVLSTGPSGVGPQMSLIIGVWRKTGESCKVGGTNFSMVQDLSRLDALLSSIVVFLKFCSELLLSVPEALSQVTILLEDMFVLVQPGGRLGSIPNDPIATALFESTKAALLETFAWLPSGSFPLVADEVFSFAADHIRQAVERSVSCSVLYSLISKEDALLDSKPFSRANKDGQVGGTKDLEEIIVVLNGEIASHDERESVIHLRSDEPDILLGTSPLDFRSIQDCFLTGARIDKPKPPTPLHEVGTWRRPVDPSVSSKVRIVDAAIQAFSSTFGLKDGKEQQGAMDMLEQLIPRNSGIRMDTSENERRSKARDDVAAVANVTAVLLSCLQALPLHEATHNIPIGLGPPWMNKAKDLLLTLLPSNSSIVRRAAAEGLALLATLGVTEDAHFLQSSLLHSLDEVMQGNKLEAKARMMSLEPVSASRAGSLLTLACIQRTSYNVAQRKRVRARGRVLGSKTDEAVDKSNENLPVLQMMTRILPSASCHGFKDFFAVKTYALHSFAVLLIYSARLNVGSIGEDDKQLLRKGIELVEDNFSSSWTSASVDLDRGQEGEKMTFETSFIAVLVRLMSFLLPFLHHVHDEDRDISRRFSVMATIILEKYGAHPMIALEVLAFFEALASNSQFLPAPSTFVIYSENPLFSCIPFLLSTLAPQRPGITWLPDTNAESEKCLQAASYLVTLMPKALVPRWNNVLVASHLVASLESFCGSRQFSGSGVCCATNREASVPLSDGTAVERQIVRSIYSTLLDRSSIGASTQGHLIRWPLLSRQLLTRFTTTASSDETGNVKDKVISLAISQAESDGSIVYETATPLRWQTKSIASQIGAEALRQLLELERSGCDIQQSDEFDLITATRSCSATEQPRSRVVFHLEDLVASACMTSVATIDQSELFRLQESSGILLHMLIQCFGPIVDPEDPSNSILHQYSTQIFASVKHMLSAWTGHPTELSSRLFIVGCKSIFSTIETGLASDASAVTRLVRPIVQPEETYRVAALSAEFMRQLSESSTSIPLSVRVGTVWVLSLLLAHPKDFLKDVTRELIKNKVGVAIEAASIAIDGGHLLYSAKRSLAGARFTHTEEIALPSRGFHYQSDFDMDDSAKEILASSWSQCCVGALQALSEELTSTEMNEEGRGTCRSWVKALISLTLAGVHDCLLASDEVEVEKNPAWTNQLKPQEILLHCLRGITLVTCTEFNTLASDFGVELERTIHLVFDRIVTPTLADKESQTETYRIEPSSDITMEACKLIRALSDSCTGDFQQVSRALLVLLLQPLSQIQESRAKLSNGSVEEVISTCLLSLSSLVRRGLTNESVVKAMVHLASNQLLSPEMEFPISCRTAAKELLAACLNHCTVSRPQKVKLAWQLASAGSWEGWAVIATLDTGFTVVGKSLEVVQAVIRDPSRSESIAGALAAVRSVCQSGSSEVVGLLLHTVGADVVGALYLFGTLQTIPESGLSNRIVICADSLKIILTAYDVVIRQESEEQLSSFVRILFTTLLAVIRFNGLPNHASPEPRSDTALGRIGAQAIVHVARTTPAAFKSCVALLTDQERALLEFAVRAEMSGYAVGTVPSNEPKKKLNLQGYRK